MKKSSTKRLSLVALLSISVAGAALAQTNPRMEPIPLKNWQVPSIQTMFKAYGSDPIGNTHFVNPGAFIFQSTVPCRVVDTRNPNGQYGGPIFGVGQTRTFSITQAIFGTCGSSFPGGIAAVSINITVTQTAGTGFVTGFATGGSLPAVSSVNWIGAGVTISNAAIVPTDGGSLSQINIYASQSTHVIIDINGIFIANISSNADQLAITTSIGGLAAIVGFNNSNAAGSHGVGGFAAGTGKVFGVQGQVSASGATDSAGVHGLQNSGTAQQHGVLGEVGSNAVRAGGVTGFATDLNANGGYFLNTGAGNVEAFLCTQIGGVNMALRSLGGRVSVGSLEVFGSKSFVSPHPENPGLEIRYASVEAPTVDVYFRGTAELVNGYARIDVPDHFRLTARDGTYMTTLTSAGRTNNLSVESEGPEGIVVRGSGSGRFHYVIYAERAEIENYSAVTRNVTFTPESMRGDVNGLPASTRALLVKNGTIHPDGSYNLETARAMGWTVKQD